jgi:hypothetical protein
MAGWVGEGTRRRRPFIVEWCSVFATRSRLEIDRLRARDAPARVGCNQLTDSSVFHNKDEVTVKYLNLTQFPLKDCTLGIHHPVQGFLSQESL